MKKDRMVRILTLAVLAMFVLAAAVLAGCKGEPGTETPAAPAAGPPPIDIIGSWKSGAAEDLGNGYFGTRDLNLTATDWEVVFTQYLDKEMTKPVYVYRASGTYAIGAASEAVGEAYDIVFTVSNRYLTLKTDDAQVIKSAGLEFCNFLKKDTEVDISTLGCSSFMTVGGCPQEFDIVKIEGADLLLGKRLYSDTVCSEDRRPNETGAPLVKF